MVDKFLARSIGYQTRMLALVEQLALNRLDVTEARSPEQLADELLGSVQPLPHPPANRAVRPHH